VTRAGWAGGGQSGEGGGPRWGLWWLAALAWWTLNGFSGASQLQGLPGADGAPITWAHALRTVMVSAWLWVPVSVLALWMAERFPLERARWPARAALHVGAGLAVVAGRVAFVHLANPLVRWYPGDVPPPVRLYFAGLDKNLFLYLLLVGAAHALLYARRLRQREGEARLLASQLAQAQLQVLKAQLHPHFLFNTLHAISTLVHRDADAAEQMIARLSELLRHSLSAGGADEVPLREELRQLEPYLDIEQVRFGGRLAVRWSVEPDALDARVPHLLLQPLVENAIRHGLSPRLAPGTVEVVARREGPQLRLEVRDDGVGLVGARAAPATPREGGGGVGLSNTRARLERLYGASHRFRLESPEGGGVVVAMELPFRAAAAPAQPAAPAAAPAAAG
jgi:signal transduction histidine kinase